MPWSAVVQSPPRKIVLVVEDDEDLCRIFARALRVAGFNVEEAFDGTQALRRIENLPPDLVVLDIRLPLLDGVAVREELAAHDETRDIPVVVVTGTDFDAERLRVSHVLRKPVPLDALLAAVCGCLTPRR